MKPENDWKKYENIKVIGYYANLKEAIAVEKAKQASSASESEEQTGKRKITINRKYRDDSISPPPNLTSRTVQKDKKSNHFKKSMQDIQDDEGLSPKESLNSTPESEESHNKINLNDKANKSEDLNQTLTPQDIEDAEIIFEDGISLTPEELLNSASGSVNASSFGTGSVSNQTSLSDMISEFKEIKSLVTYTIHRVGKIEQLLQSGRLSEKKQSLLPTLPLMELIQLQSLEEKMEDEQIKQQLFDLLRFTGGSRERDCVNRNLEKLFSNYLAQFCSWTGKKQNFKLSTLILIATLKLAVKESFPNMTDESFERHVMSWFQHASTRLKRQNRD